MRGAIALFVMLVAGPLARAEPARAGHARVTVLSTMVPDGPLVAEWGFSALVEVDGKKILFDTGLLPDTVLRNLATLKLDLADVTDVVLSHAHEDHIGGLMTLRRAFAAKNPAALSRTHVGPGFFDNKSSPKKLRSGFDPAVRRAYEQGGGHFIVHEGPVQLAPGVWLTGPIQRIHPEHNYPQDVMRDTPHGSVPDHVEEEIALVVDTSAGLVVITGCGHAGVINTLEAARKVVRTAPVVALIGGLHTFLATEEVLAWTATQLKRLQLRQLLSAHCTGFEATLRLRSLLGLDAAHCAIASTSAVWDSDTGVKLGLLR